jgi:hypothetical protein
MTFTLGLPVSGSGPAAGPSSALFAGFAQRAAPAELEVLDAMARRHRYPAIVEQIGLHPCHFDPSWTPTKLSISDVSQPDTARWF